jgi:hypothetical protein
MVDFRERHSKYVAQKDVEVVRSCGDGSQQPDIINDTERLLFDLARVQQGKRGKGDD